MNPEQAPQDEESTPEDLQRRIERFKQRRKPDPGLGRAVALVLSLGVTFVTVMYGSFLLGSELDRRGGTTWCLPVALLLGAAAGFWVGYLLIRPLLRDDR